MQEIQFLEFMGGFNFSHAHSNYLICMHFVRINTVLRLKLLKPLSCLQLVSTAKRGLPQQQWTCQPLRRSTPLPRLSPLKLISQPLVSGASLCLAFYAQPSPLPHMSTHAGVCNDQLHIQCIMLIQCAGLVPQS